MSRVSGSFVWGIRWETVARNDGIPVFGGMIPHRYTSRGQARRNTRRLTRTFPVRCNPFDQDDDQPVRYIIVARGLHEPFGL